MRRLALFIMLSASCDGAATYEPAGYAGDIAIYEPYAPASPAPEIASVYFALVNRSMRTDSLTGVRIEGGGVATIHQSGDGGMRMLPALPVAAGSTVRLKPGSYHVMIDSLPEPLVVGDTVRVELDFASGSTASLDVPVVTYADLVRRLERFEDSGSLE